MKFIKKIAAPIEFRWKTGRSRNAYDELFRDLVNLMLPPHAPGVDGDVQCVSTRAQLEILIQNVRYFVDHKTLKVRAFYDNDDDDECIDEPVEFTAPSVRPLRAILNRWIDDGIPFKEHEGWQTFSAEEPKL